MSDIAYNNHTYAEAMWKGLNAFRCPNSYEPSYSGVKVPVPSGLNSDYVVDMCSEFGRYRVVHFVDSFEKVRQTTPNDVWVHALSTEGKYSMASVSRSDLSTVHSALVQVKGESG